MGEFGGFSRDFFRFFDELAVNNKREWFLENKPRYQAVVLGEMGAFIEAMAPRLADISDHFVADPKTNGGSMFRIYRDVRFSKDKRPYKEHAACHFRHEAGKDAHAPGFYVEISPNRVVYGGGIWKAARPELERIRQAISHDIEGWSDVISDTTLSETFGGVAGDGLKRPPRGFAADHPHIEDIKRQSFYAMRFGSVDGAMRADFTEQVGSAFRAATPLMRFLTEAVGRPF